MTQLVKLTRSGQITIPATLRKELHLEEGDYMEIRQAEGYLILIPKQLINKEQTYFWTHAWQEGEREAEEDIRAGRVEIFDSIDDFFTDLDEGTPDA